MKKYLIICFLCIFGINTVNAQYYNPYNTAIAIAQTNETYQLNNIKFDVNAISKNPIALNEYNCYVERHNTYAQRAKNSLIWGYTGCGVALLGCIPMCWYSNSIAFYSGCAITSIGAIIGISGNFSLILRTIFAVLAPPLTFNISAPASILLCTSVNSDTIVTTTGISIDSFTYLIVSSGAGEFSIAPIAP